VRERAREDELREVPLWKANKTAWPPGVRAIKMDEADCLASTGAANSTGTTGTGPLTPLEI
jgi:hypothetical protein